MKKMLAFGMVFLSFGMVFGDRPCSQYSNYDQLSNCLVDNATLPLTQQGIYNIPFDLIVKLVFASLYGEGKYYQEQGELDKALYLFKKTLSPSLPEDLRSLALYKIDETEQLMLKQNAPSNDPLSHVQFYLNALNVPQAWNKVTNSKEVIVAVIDDGVDINHPELTYHIWKDPNAKYGASLIKDFVGDGMGDNLPVGEHGTMVAGIIAATTNNGVGIAGIAKNVKIMPLRVFDENGKAKEQNIIDAMNYAIDKGANIINLSLGQSQFKYSTKYDAVIKKAFNKGVVVVIAAGNGNVLSNNANGINTTNNPISPACNNGGTTEYSLTVMAIDVNGKRTPWSNYGSCVSLAAPGVDIVSTSIAVYNSNYGEDYNALSGTSFSAPMISGVIALGFNQYGSVSPSIVRESLQDSLSGGTLVDASKYLDALQSRIANVQRDKNAEILANAGIINPKDNDLEYHLDDYVLRQEVMGVALKLGKINIPENYVCKNVFGDVSRTKPNNWACKSIETGASLGIVSISNKLFRPEDTITSVEALAILMKSANIAIPSVSDNWMMNVSSAGLLKGFIEGKFSPEKKATRRAVFDMARRILEQQ